MHSPLRFLTGGIKSCFDRVIFQDAVCEECFSIRLRCLYECFSIHLPLYFAFSSEVLNRGIKSCFDGVVFQDAVCEECFSISLRCLKFLFLFTFNFCYCFYEDFIHKTILVSQFLPFICFSYPLKIFKSDTGILRDSCAVPLLKLWLFYVWFTGRQQNCCWILLLHWVQLYLFLALSKSMFFELPRLIPLVLYLIHSVSAAEVSLMNCISLIRFRCSSFFWPWENQYMVHSIDSISVAQFPAMICSVSAEGFLNRVAHSI